MARSRSGTLIRPSNSWARIGAGRIQIVCSKRTRARSNLSEYSSIAKAKEDTGRAAGDVVGNVDSDRRWQTGGWPPDHTSVYAFDLIVSPHLVAHDARLEMV